MEQAIFFPGLGIGVFTLNRVAFSIGNLNIYWYGIIIAASFLAATGYILLNLRKFGLDHDRAFDVLLAAVVGGIFGARIYYIAFSWDHFQDDLLSIFKTWEGGIAIYGAVIGGTLTALLFCKIRRVKFIPFVDLSFTGLLLAQAIGRWGNFVNVEAFGTNTTLPWGMASPEIGNYLTRHQAALAAIGVTVDPYLPVHPTFFYESVWCLLGFLLLVWYTKRRRFDGELALMYGAWYSFGRFFIEGLRTDSLMAGNVRVSQALAALLTVGCTAAVLFIHGKARKKDGAYPPLYVDTPEGQAVLSGEFYKKASVPKEDEDTDAGEVFDPIEPSGSNGDQPENETHFGTSGEEAQTDEGKTD